MCVHFGALFLLLRFFLYYLPLYLSFMFFLFLYLAPNLFCFLSIRFLICSCVFSGDLLVEISFIILKILFRFFCFSLTWYLLTLPFFIKIYWHFSSSYIVNLVYCCLFRIFHFIVLLSIFFLSKYSVFFFFVLLTTFPTWVLYFIWFLAWVPIYDWQLLFLHELDCFFGGALFPLGQIIPTYLFFWFQSWLFSSSDSLGMLI